MAKKTKSTLPNYNDIYKGVTKELAADEKAAIKSSNDSYDAQGNLIKENYAGQISETEKSYDSAYRDNAVQKKVNEFKITEDMANMGLTNSGLSRMQVTANNLSYANKKGSITMQKQSMVDSLTRDMNQLLGQLDIEKQSAAQGIKDNYAALAESRAGTMYSAALTDYYDKLDRAYKKERDKIADEQWEKSFKASRSSSGGSGGSGGNNTPSDSKYIYSHSTTTDEGNEYSVYYKDGKEIKLPKGYNPYADDYVDSKVAEEYGVFNNGYQPKGISGYGAVTEEDTVPIGDSKLKIWYTVSKQSVDSNSRRTVNKKNYWVWNAKKNKYVTVELLPNGEWNIPNEEDAEGIIL